MKAVKLYFYEVLFIMLHKWSGLLRKKNVWTKLSCVTLSFDGDFSGTNNGSPWWTALKALLLPGPPWAPPGDPLVSWDCERWWFAKSTVRSFLPCLEVSAAEGFKYSEGTSLKKNVLLGSNWNRSAKEKDSSRFCLTKCHQRGLYWVELAMGKGCFKTQV